MMFPKPGKKPKKKPTRELDPPYIKWIHSYACIVCGSYPVHAHHVKSKGAGGSDRTCLPLCHHHHVGNDGIHLLGRAHFQAKFKIELEALVEHYNALYNDGAVGPHAHKVPHINIVSG